MKYLLVVVMLFSGCATMRATGQDRPENRFMLGATIVLPALICGAFGIIPCWYVAGAGWVWGMSGAVEGCQKQDGNPFCYRTEAGK